MLKEPVNIMLVRVEEKLRALTDLNSIEHKEIIINQKELSSFVNHEYEVLATRIAILEKQEIINSTTIKAFKRLALFIVGLVGFTSTLIGLILYLGIV